MNKKITYKDAGVDIKKADEAIEMSKKEISSTFSKDVLSSIGGFGSMYSLKNIFNNFISVSVSSGDFSGLSTPEKSAVRFNKTLKPKSTRSILPFFKKG